MVYGINMKTAKRYDTVTFKITLLAPKREDTMPRLLKQTAFHFHCAHRFLRPVRTCLDFTVSRVFASGVSTRDW